MPLALGVDAGGTTSRAVLSDLDGHTLGRGKAGPGNPLTAGSAAATSIGTAIRAALGYHNPADVIAAVVGVAGVTALSDPAVTDAFAREWQAIGLTGTVEIVGDAITAFAAGTTADHGTVLIAGTGAVAAVIANGQITRTADGLGWLLGDEGSGLWLGLQALRAAARDFDTSLAATIAAHLGVRTRDELVHWASRVPPPTFANLAPLVCRAARDNDPTAAELVADASTHLIATLDQLEMPDAPIVLAGSLLTARTPVREGVLKLLSRRPNEVSIAKDPAAGAARLAIRRTFHSKKQIN